MDARKILLLCFPLLLLIPSCGERERPRGTEGAVPSHECGRAGERGAAALRHVEALAAMGGRPSGSAAYARQLDYLQEHLERAGWTCRRMSWTESNPLTGDEVPMTNLYARWGENPDFASVPDGLLTCHIDTKTGIPGFVGADDGASGAAVLLETARALGKFSPAAQQVELVFFDGEEAFAPHMTPRDGLFGSRRDAARRGERLPRWMINLDMVGGRGKTIAIPSEETSQEMYELYRRAAETLGFPVNRWQVALGSVYDDHLPFHRAGVDTLNLIAQFSDSDWWHTPRDDASRISARSLEETILFVLRMLEQLLPAEFGDGAHPAP